MDVMDQSKKERLRRLSELNMRSLGVTSFEAPEAGAGMSVTRELVRAIREQKSMICRRQEVTGRAGHAVRAWTWKYRNL